MHTYWNIIVILGTWVILFIYCFTSLYWNDKTWKFIYFIILGSWTEVVNVPQYWMVYFYLISFLDWLRYKLQHLKIKSYYAWQVWIYFNICIIISSNRATTIDIHRPLWREMGWKEKRFHWCSNIHIRESWKCWTHHGRQTYTTEYRYHHNRVHHSRTTVINAIWEEVWVEVYCRWHELRVPKARLAKLPRDEPINILACLEKENNQMQRRLDHFYAIQKARKHLQGKA